MHALAQYAGGLLVSQVSCQRSGRSRFHNGKSPCRDSRQSLARGRLKVRTSARCTRCYEQGVQAGATLPGQVLQHLLLNGEEVPLELTRQAKLSPHERCNQLAEIECWQLHVLQDGRKCKCDLDTTIRSIRCGLCRAKSRALQEDCCISCEQSASAPDCMRASLRPRTMR